MNRHGRAKAVIAFFLTSVITLVALMACLSDPAVTSRPTEATLVSTSVPKSPTAIVIGTPTHDPTRQRADFLTGVAFTVEAIRGPDATKAAKFDITGTFQAEQAATASAAEKTQSQALPGILAQLAQSYVPLDLSAGHLYTQPIPLLTDDQVADAYKCSFNSELSAEPKTACDWAVLAAAIALTGNGDPQTAEMGRQAYSQAVLLNPAFALKAPLFDDYFGSVALVAPPPQSASAVTTLFLGYSKTGSRDGDFSNHLSFDITMANNSPHVIGSVSNPLEFPSFKGHGHPSWWEEKPFEGGSASAADIQAIRAALTDLIPLPYAFYSVNPNFSSCEGVSRPDWGFTLIMDDGTFIQAHTDANFVLGGGPWFVTVDGQDYVQASTVLTRAISPLAMSLTISSEPLDTRIVPFAGCKIVGENPDLVDYYGKK